MRLYACRRPSWARQRLATLESVQLWRRRLARSGQQPRQRARAAGSMRGTADAAAENIRQRGSGTTAGVAAACAWISGNAAAFSPAALSQYYQRFLPAQQHISMRVSSAQRHGGGASSARRRHRLVRNKAFATLSVVIRGVAARGCWRQRAAAVSAAAAVAARIWVSRRAGAGGYAASVAALL